MFFGVPFLGVGFRGNHQDTIAIVQVESKRSSPISRLCLEAVLCRPHFATWLKPKPRSPEGPKILNSGATQVWPRFVALASLSIGFLAAQQPKHLSVVS